MYGKSLSVKVCVEVCSSVLVLGSEKDSCPTLQSSWTLILRGFSVTVRTVKPAVEPAVYVPSFNIIPQFLPPSLPFLWQDPANTPTVQFALSPTSTSQL